MHAEDRRTRLIAFAVITMVFAICMSALVYWAVNVASAKISSKVSTNKQTPSPIIPNANIVATQALKTTSSLNADIRLCRFF